MSVTFFTIDFWQTLYDSSNGEARNARRREALIEAIALAYDAPDTEACHQAYAGLWDYFDSHWLGARRTPTSQEMVREVLRRLDCSLTEEAMAAVVKVFEEGVLEHPPALLPGVREGLEYLASAGRLALISDTAFSPGAVLRRLMERDGIASYFDAFVFSDETGVAKPHPDAFTRALEGIGGRPERGVHIGDIERTDIRGAKEAGMKAILYRSPHHLHKYAEQETSADAVMEEWREIGEVIERLKKEG